MEATWNGALFSAATIRLPVSTQSGQNDFPKAASQPQQGSANRNAPKLPLATSPNRPIAALQPSVKVIIGQAALLRLQTLMLKVATRIELALST